MCDLIKCYTCGAMHETRENVIEKKCPFEKTKNTYCDDWCFKWRYYDPIHKPNRYFQKYFTDLEMI